MNHIYYSFDYKTEIWKAYVFSEEVLIKSTGMGATPELAKRNLEHKLKEETLNG